MPDLTVQLGRLALANPVMVASGTFGYVREMEPFVDVRRLGAVLPKTVTRRPRAGNRPWRTVETSAGLLNAIGLDNDGLEVFMATHLPYLARLRPDPGNSAGTRVIVSIAGESVEDFVFLARQLDATQSVDALELNISCPNVAHGIDFGIEPDRCRRLVSEVRSAVELPLLVKLTPNVTDIAAMARSCQEAGADAVSVINTVLGLAINWRTRRTMLDHGMGGLSGPAIKPIALRCVYQVAHAVDLPVVGVGGIAHVDDAMQFLVAGATAIQVGTANYYDPSCSLKILDAIPGALMELGVASWREVIGSRTCGQ